MVSPDFHGIRDRAGKVIGDGRPDLAIYDPFPLVTDYKPVPKSMMGSYDDEIQEYLMKKYPDKLRYIDDYYKARGVEPEFLFFYYFQK